MIRCLDCYAEFILPEKTTLGEIKCINCGSKNCEVCLECSL